VVYGDRLIFREKRMNMECPQCYGAVKNEYVEDYYGGTQYEKCSFCGYVVSKAWYPDGGAPWDYVDDDDYYDQEDEFETLVQDCGKNREGWCELIGTDYCDWKCPFPAIDELEEESE
jgi:hypothetical protein